MVNGLKKNRQTITNLCRLQCPLQDLLGRLQITQFLRNSDMLLSNKSINPAGLEISDSSYDESIPTYLKMKIK